MRFQIPRDYEMLPEFVRLVEQCEKRFHRSHSRWLASYLFLRLWAELTYQSENHLLPGRFDRRNVDTFGLQVSDVGDIEGVMDVFVESGMLEEFDYGWFCKRFASTNFTMAHPWLDNGERQKARYDYGKLSQRTRSRLPSAIELIPAENWPADLPLQLRDTVVVFIRTLDGICDLPARHGEQFGAGLINSAWCAIRNMPPEKLDAAMRRIHFVQRTKPDHRIPRETELLLRDFARVLWIAMPDAWWDEGSDYTKSAA